MRYASVTVYGDKAVAQPVLLRIEIALLTNPKCALNYVDKKYSQHFPFLKLIFLVITKYLARTL